MAVPGPGSLSGVAIYACDVARLCDFYVTVLGLTVVERDDGYAVLAGAAGEVSVVAIPKEIAQGIVITAPPQLREETPVKPVFVVADLAVAATRAAAAGGGSKEPSAAWTFRGLRRLDGWDPEGNVIQLAERDPVP